MERATLSDPLSIKSHYLVQLKDPDTGKILEEREGKNLVVTRGKELMANRLAGLNTGTYLPIGYVGIGLSNTAPSASDTDLLSPVDRKGMDSGFPAWTPGTGKVAFQSTWAETEPAGQPYQIYEIGLFDSLSAGNMLNRIVLAAPITKTDAMELSVKITIEFT